MRAGRVMSANGPLDWTAADRGEWIPAAVTWGLFLAWVLHDAEELATMPGWVGRNRARLVAALPWVPARVWDRLDVDRRHVTAAIGLMGGLMLAASARGSQTGGHSVVYQTALTGFGLHAVTHLAQSAVVRGYTPGVVTAPLVAAPFSVWARRQLRQAGVPVTGGGVAAFAALPVVLGGVHTLAAVLVRCRIGRRSRTRAVLNG
jgi:hypothetical protein